MCGISGIFDRSHPAPVDEELLRRMNDTLIHRGPDDGGLLVQPGVGLGHRRLSIIDLSGGHQPIFNEDGSVAVVFNGEIYNYRELAKELEALGHTLATHSDTEVIVHAWEQWGDECVQRFRGMFAFAIWDQNRKTLFLARDRMGIKPLYYAWLGERLIFGSELKALTAHPELNRELDEAAVEDYFAYGYIPEPRSIYRGVSKLEPGHALLIRRGEPEPQPRQYWDVPFEPVSVSSQAQAQEELIERLREAVQIRLVAEVPLGAFLSGGVDSSAVVALMAQTLSDPRFQDPMAQGGTGGKVRTCSIGFGDPKFNETEFAAEVAEHCSTEHRSEQVDPEDFDLISKLAGLYDEPYADSSALPTYRVCELARKQVTVALSGDGGDENFAGYTRYRWHMDEERLRGRFPSAMRKNLFKPLGQMYPTMAWAPRVLRAKATFTALGNDWVSGYFRLMAFLEDHERFQLYSPAMKARLGGYHGIEVMQAHAARCPTDHPLSRVQYMDYKTYLPGDILTKVDRASMAHALEVRVPVLDHKFVEWSSGLPPEWKLQGHEGKAVFKSALEPHLPEGILYRPKKGFSVPLAQWFRGPLKDRLEAAVLSERMQDCGLFDMAFLKKVLAMHQGGHRDMSASLWSLLMFDSFLKQRELG